MSIPLRPSVSTLKGLTAAVIGLIALPGFACAELPSPRLDRVTPLGAATGSTLEVEIVGADLEDAKTLLFDHPGIQAEFIKDRFFRVTVQADVPPGTYDARVIGRYGISSPRLFAISRGCIEIAEKGPNSEPAEAQILAMNTIVNGLSDGNREDFFRFPAKKGQRVVIECVAQRLDSDLDATLTLTDRDGKPLASNGDYFGRDPLIDFLAPQDGEYYLSLHDLSFRGGLPYRLIVTNLPKIENVFPRALQVGASTELTVFGRNLGKTAQASPWKINDLALEQYRQSFTPPVNVWEPRAYRFLEHPTTHSVLPTAATATLTGFQVTPTPSGIAADPIPVLLTDTAVTLESEPNDRLTSPQKIAIPAVISGRFNTERDADWFELETTEAGSYAFEVYCERIAGRADPYLAVVDEKGERVGELDDFGIRMNAFDGHLRDPSGVINLQAKKKYRVLVQDRYQRGGARYQYVFTVHKAVPNFYPAVIHNQNPGPGGITIRPGGATYLDIVIHRTEGFNGPITITAEGLPKGIHAPATTIPSDTRGALVLWADKTAPAGVGPIKLVATGRQGDRTLVREVRPYTRVLPQANQNSSRPTRELVIATLAHTAPFSLTPSQDRLEVEAGKKLDLLIRCERIWPEFKGAITVNALSFPGPFKMGTVNIAENKTEANIGLDVQAGTQPGEYTLTLLAQAQVPFTKDAKTAAANTLVSLPSQPFTVTVRAAKK